MPFNVHAKELLNYALRVYQNAPNRNKGLESEQNLNFCFVCQSSASSWKSSQSQICKYKHQRETSHIEGQICLGKLRRHNQFHEKNDEDHDDAVVEEHEQKVEVVEEIVAVLEQFCAHGHLS